MNNNNLNDIPPADYTDEQKKEYIYLLRQSRVMFPDVEDFILKIGVNGYIRCGGKERFENKEDIEKLKKQYEDFTFDAEELAKKPFNVNEKEQDDDLPINENGINFCGNKIQEIQVSAK